MSSSATKKDEKFNLSNVSVLALESSALGYTILTSALHGFGIREIYGPSSVAEATSLANSTSFHIVIADPDFDDGKALEFVRWLRRAADNPNRFIPVILTYGHTTVSDVQLARDFGANIVVAKPYSAQVLLERVIRASRDKRPFVEAPGYVGPDRRFKADDQTDDKLRRRQNDEDTGAEDANTLASADKSMAPDQKVAGSDRGAA